MIAGDAILLAEQIGMRFGAFVALNDVSVEFRRGRLTSIIGPNGAGKSTFFNIASGALSPSAGRIWFDGAEITGLAQHHFARRGIAKSFQITNVFPWLTTLENVRVAAQVLHTRFDFWRPREQRRDLIERAARLLDLVGLYKQRERHAATLAHGEQRSLEVAMALACDPKLLLLDEPTAGMSPGETKSMMDLIVRLAAERTVVLVEHKMKLVMGISDHIVVLHHGELLAQGSPGEIRANPEVRLVYLGQAA
jgi:branched-chain amino acid transport system ATP-binding protein